MIKPPYAAQRPPTYPTYDDIRDTTFGPEPTVPNRPMTTLPPRTTTEFVETDMPDSTGSYVTDEFSFGDDDSSTDSASNSNNFDTSTSTWWGNNKRKRDAAKALMDRH